MWLNSEKVVESSIYTYRKSLLTSFPNHVVIDNLFNETKLGCVLKALRQPYHWNKQNHTYSDLYIDSTLWSKTSEDHRFVQRYVWQRDEISAHDNEANTAIDFLSFLRGDTFMSLLSRIFNVFLTDMNVAEPKINTNYFRLSADDFVKQHADYSLGRKVCMLLYLNKRWPHDEGGELVFMGKNEKSVSIIPLYNRCVLFDPSSKGSEHWVKTLNSKNTHVYRYNVTSWYWSE